MVEQSPIRPEQAHTQKTTAWVYTNNDAVLTGAVEALLQTNTIAFERNSASGSSGAVEYRVDLNAVKFDDMQRKLSGLAFLTRTRTPYVGQAGFEPDKFNRGASSQTIVVVPFIQATGGAVGPILYTVPAGQTFYITEFYAISFPQAIGNIAMCLQNTGAAWLAWAAANEVIDVGISSGVAAGTVPEHQINKTQNQVPIPVPAGTQIRLNHNPAAGGGNLIGQFRGWLE